MRTRQQGNLKNNAILSSIRHQIFTKFKYQIPLKHLEDDVLFLTTRVYRATLPNAGRTRLKGEEGQKVVPGPERQQGLHQGRAQGKACGDQEQNIAQLHIEEHRAAEGALFKLR